MAAATVADDDLTFAAHLRPKHLPSHPCSGPDCLEPGLLKCGRCHAVKYCSRAHQEADFPSHKYNCKQVAIALRAVQREKTELVESAARGEDFFLSGNPFEVHVGHFWGLVTMRDYMVARARLIENIREIGTPVALSMALNLVLGSLRLNRGDNQGLRNWAPGLFLRLNMEQECFDFICWWSTFAAESDHDSDDLTLPYLHVQGTSIAARQSWRPYGLAMLVAVMLLKYKAWQRIKDFHRFWTFMIGVHAKSDAPGPRQLVGKAELLMQIQDFVGRPKVFFDQGGAEAELYLHEQVAESVVAVKAHNEWMFPILMDEDTAEDALLRNPPAYYSQGDQEEAMLAIRSVWHCWNELLTDNDKDHLFAL